MSARRWFGAVQTMLSGTSGRLQGGSQDSRHERAVVRDRRFLTSRGGDPRTVVGDDMGGATRREGSGGNPSRVD